MADTFSSLDKQIAEIEENLRLIAERKSEYPQPETIPLDLIKNERRFDAQLADLVARRQRLHAIPCPYRGLEYFDVQHAANYFGRAAMVQKLLAKLAESNFVAVVGPSGSGKSSLVRAGLLPALREGKLPDSETWAVEIFRPGDDPLRGLALALVNRLMPAASPVDRLAEARKLADHLRNRTLPMADVLAQWRGQTPGPARLLLLADQFEEAYTLCRDDPCRRAFLDALLAAAETPWVTVLFTLRADFYGRVLEDERFGRRVDTGLVNVLAMTRDERRATVEQPALRAGCRFEEGLAERILDAVQDAPGDLPLLEFALTELWERQTADGVLAHMAYEAIGEVRGAIAKRAEETLDDLKRRGLGEATRRLLTSLVHLTATGDDTGLRRHEAVIQSDAELTTVVRILSDARLVVTGWGESTGDPIVELAHDALTTEWRTLQGWLNEDREFLLWRQRMRDRYYEWNSRGYDTDILLRGPALFEAENWLEKRARDLYETEREFILNSISHRQQLHEKQLFEQRERERRRKQVLYSVVGVAVAFMVVAGFASFQWLRARAQQEMLLARQLAAQAQTLLGNTGTDLVQSTLLAIESVRRYVTPEGTTALRSGTALLPRQESLIKYETAADLAALSYDGSLAATATMDGRIAIWDMSNQVRVARIDNGSQIKIMIFDRNSHWLATGGQDRVVRLWQLPEGVERMKMMHTTDITAMAFSSDGTQLAIGYDDGIARVWGTSTAKETVQLNHGARVNDIGISDNNQWIATGGADGQTVLWTNQDAVETLRFGSGNEVNRLKFSPSGRLLATASMISETGTGLVEVWSVPSGDKVGTMPTYDFVLSMAFSHDEQWIAAGSGGMFRADGEVSCFEIVTGRELWHMRYGSGVHFLVFNSDSSLLAVGSYDAASVREVRTGREFARGVQEDMVYNIRFGAGNRLVTDGKEGARVSLLKSEFARIENRFASLTVSFNPTRDQVAMGWADNTVTIWSTSRSRQLARLIHDGWVHHLAFSHDGKWLATASYYSTRIWNTETFAENMHLPRARTTSVIAFSPNDQWLATGGDDGIVHLWDITTGSEVAQLVHQGMIRDLAFCSDGRRLATGSKDGTARIWEVPSGRELVRMAHEAGVSSLALSQDGRWLATGTEDGKVYVWNTQTGRTKLSFLSSSRILSIAYSSDGRLIAGGSDDDSVTAWDSNTGRQVFRGPHQSGGHLVRFSPDAKWLLSAGWNHSLKVWEASTGKQIAQITHQGDAYDADFSPNGRYLASTGADGVVDIGLYRPADLISAACERLIRNLTQNEWDQYLPGEPYRRTCDNLP